MRQWISSITSQEQTSTDLALLKATQQAERGNRLALKWGRHWLSVTIKRRSKQDKRPFIRPLPYSRGSIIAEHSPIQSELVIKPPRTEFNHTKVPALQPLQEVPNFYSQFTVLRSQRPAPKIPSFFVQKKYCKDVKEEVKVVEKKSVESSVKYSGLLPPSAFI